MLTDGPGFVRAPKFDRNSNANTADVGEVVVGRHAFTICAFGYSPTSGFLIPPQAVHEKSGRNRGPALFLIVAGRGMTFSACGWRCRMARDLLLQPAYIAPGEIAHVRAIATNQMRG